MQMVSVLALNKLELKEMINAEIVENPVLEEVEENVPLLDEMAGREAERDRSVSESRPKPRGKRRILSTKSILALISRTTSIPAIALPTASS